MPRRSRPTGLRSRASILLIKAARRVLLGRGAQRWRITQFVHRRVVDSAWGRDLIEVTFRGLRLVVPTRDHTIVPGIIGGFYEQHELDLFERLAAVSPKIVDVGGNIGVYAAVGASRMPTAGRLIVFEPVAENYDLLVSNLALNGLTAGIEVVAAAVGDQEGELTLHLAPLSVGTHSASASNASGGRGVVEQVVVPMHTLDTFPSTDPAQHQGDPVTLLKLDVEGFDGHVLRGAEALLRAQRPTLLVEYVRPHLEGCGFDPEEFVNRVFDSYDAVWAVTGSQGRISMTTREAVLAGPNANLVAVSRPEHKEIVELWAAGG